MPRSGGAVGQVSVDFAGDDAVADAGVILITGPANEKTELVKHIRKHAPELEKKIVAVETVDHPSDRQLIDHARRHFKIDHMLPPRIAGR